MPPPDKSRFWPKCRIGFRRFRTCVLFGLFLVVASVAYLNQVGLPDFLKRPLLEKLRVRGLDLQFTRLRWRGYHGLVAENVHFGRTADPGSPRLTVDEVQVRLNYRALAKLQFQVDSLVLNKGRLIWPVVATNEPPRELSVAGIQTELRLLPDDVWELADFKAQFAGAHIQLAGVVTNASAVRDWTWLRLKEPAAPGTLRSRLRRVADTLEQVHFSTAPQLKVDVRGDAKHFQSFAVRFALDAPDADTPWGTFERGRLTLLLWAAGSNVQSHAELKLQADSAQMRQGDESHWAGVTNLALMIRVFSDEPDTNVVSGELDLSAGSLQSEWGRAARSRFQVRWVHSFTNAIPISGQGDVDLEDAVTQWGNAKELHFTSRLAYSTSPPQMDATWAWWTNLAPYEVDCECRVVGWESPRLNADEFLCSGRWSAPRLELSRISGGLYGGRLEARGNVDVATRECTFAGSSDFDAAKISGLLTERGRYWLSQFAWKQPPLIKAQGGLTLPAWTNQHPDWRGEVRPTVRLNGDFKIKDGAFREVPFSSVQSHFTYSNLVWRLPDLAIARPEGALDLDYVLDEATRDYYLRLQSTIDVRALRPLLEPGPQRGFDLAGFTAPPQIAAEVWGRLYELDRTGVKARLAVTNFSFRDQVGSWAESGIEYTNRVLQFLAPRVERGLQVASATRITADFNTRLVYVTNGFTTMDPLVVARAIGPRIGRHVEPFHFVQPPTGRVNGVISMRDEMGTDLHFDLNGGPFEWWKFRVPRIAGKVDWMGRRLQLNDVEASFYSGTALGNAEFDFTPKYGADFNFDVIITDADLHPFIEDISGKPNRMEGLLTGRLNVSHANTTDWQSWQGKGRANLRDGLIWEIPVFGVLSPVLDGIMPGLGSSRAREGTASFVITNGVIHSGDLQLRASIMRLQYWGTVDLQGQVNARVEAELFRDMWVFGKLVSLALWPVSKVFEYQITGTLDDPKTGPVFFLFRDTTPLPSEPAIFEPYVPSEPGVPGSAAPPGPRSEAPPPTPESDATASSAVGDPKPDAPARAADPP